MKENYNKLNNLKKFRTALGLSQTSIAKEAGIYLRLYQYYESGEREPCVTNAIKLAKVLNTTVEALFSLNNEAKEIPCFSSRLKELRTNNNLTQIEIANYLNISERTIIRYENNTRNPEIDVVIKLANLFNVSVDYLVGHSEEM